MSQEVVSVPKIDIRPDHWVIVQGILRSHVPEYEVWAFGSRVKWTAKEYSDLDLAVVSDHSLPLEVIAALVDDFSESSLPWKVDLVDFAAVSEEFQKIIERDRVTVQEAASTSTSTSTSLRSVWRYELLENVAAPDKGAIAIGPFGSRLKTDTYTKSGVALIRGQNLTDSKVLSGEFVFISDETARTLGNANVKPFDLVFPHRGNIGSVGIVPEGEQKYALSTSLMKITLDREKVEPLFLYYFFRTSQGRAELLKNASQVGTPGIATPLTSLRACVVPVPPLTEQTAIAEFLSLLDDRIDLLRRTNAILESIVQTTFKSWFIDFDPVYAKAEGRDPVGMNEETAALFPHSFEDSALGEIPKGWSCTRLGDLLELSYGKALKSTDRRHGDIPVYGSGGVTGFHDEALVSEGSIIVGRKGTVGSLYWEDGPFYPIDTTFYVKPKTAPLTYCYYAMQRLGLENMNTDAAVPGLNRENAYRIKLIRPDEAALKVFDDFALAVRHSIYGNGNHIKVLENLRDALLPRLIFGKLRLPKLRLN